MRVAVTGGWVFRNPAPTGLARGGSICSMSVPRTVVTRRVAPFTSGTFGNHCLA